MKRKIEGTLSGPIGSYRGYPHRAVHIGRLGEISNSGGATKDI